jgi:hypothetical protein
MDFDSVRHSVGGACLAYRTLRGDFQSSPVDLGCSQASFIKPLQFGTDLINPGKATVDSLNNTLKDDEIRLSKWSNQCLVG